MIISASELAAELVRCRSVTPEEGGAQRLLQTRLERLGFVCERMKFSTSGTPDVENLYARRGKKAPLFCFAGHTDVVPEGDAKGWRFPPFGAEIADGRLYGRGVSDMKGGIAAFIAAVARFLEAQPEFDGSLGLLITGDEEGPALNGTAKMLEVLAGRGERIAACLVGEPTNPLHLGEEVKIGRRGSLNGRLEIEGEQGHAAWPQRVQSPIPLLVAILAEFGKIHWDEGTEHFSPTHLTLTSIDAGNPAYNVIPAKISAQFNLRFNDHHTPETIQKRLHQICETCLEGRKASFTLDFQRASLCFYNPPGRLAHLLRASAAEATGVETRFSTSGGTSDARFIKDYADEVVEFGLTGETMHKVNENARLEDIESLSQIYEKVLAAYFNPNADAV